MASTWRSQARRALVRAGRDDVHFVSHGQRRQLHELVALAGQLGIADFVTFTGRVPDETVFEVLSTADVGLCPDPLNPLNDVSTMNKTMEYMAFELPVVAFDLKETAVSAGGGRVRPAQRHRRVRPCDPRASRRPGTTRGDGRRGRAGSWTSWPGSTRRPRTWGSFAGLPAREAGRGAVKRGYSSAGAFCQSRSKSAGSERAEGRPIGRVDDNPMSRPGARSSTLLQSFGACARRHSRRRSRAQLG